MAKLVPFTTDQTEAQLAYIAGIVDGEGCFYFGNVKQGRYGNGTQWHCKLAVTSCDRCLTDWLTDVFGGCKEQRYRYTSKKSFCRPVHRWDASGLLLDFLCPRILPYLIIKKPQCELMIKIRETYKNIGSKRLPQHIVNIRLEYLQQMRNLNSRFHDHPLKKEQ